MPEIRLIGGLLGLIAVVLGLIGLRHHRKAGILRMRDLAALTIGIGLLLIAIFPRLFDAVASVFGIASLEGRRVAILTVLGFAVLAIGLFVAIGRIGDLQRQIGDLALEVSTRTPVFERLEAYPPEFVAVVIPAYNEEESLPAVLKAVPKVVEGTPTVTIVVSDGSTDGTVREASAAAAVVLERPLRRGSGAAIRTGVAFALDHGAAILTTLDADGQHDPAELGLLVRPVLEGRAEMAQGSRIENSEEVSGHRLRVVGVGVFGWFLRKTLAIEAQDPSNGFRAISADAYRRLTLMEDQFYVGEFIVRSAREDLRIVDIPVTVSPRTHGDSKKPGSVLYGFGFAKGIMRAMMRSSSRR